MVNSVMEEWQTGGIGTRRRPKGQDYGAARCGLRPVGAIRAYAPEGRWKRRKLGRCEDEKVGNREIGNFEQLK
jgi:hypothetical protein